jgi:probable phosphoglycerate mutase
MRVCLLRHGPTEWNAQGRVQGHTDIPLSPEGMAKMQALLPPPPFHKACAYASPLLRARQTAEAMGLSAPILDARLMEQNWGRWEGLRRADILAQDGADAFTRAGLAAAFHPPGGESTQALHDRVAAFLREIAKRREDAAVVAHLGVLRAAYTLATGWDMATPMPDGLDISKALVLELAEDGSPSLHAMNVDLSPRTA